MVEVATAFSLDPDEVMRWKFTRFQLWHLIVAERNHEHRQLAAVAIGEAAVFAFADPGELRTLIPERLRPPEPTPEQRSLERKREAREALARAERIRRMQDQREAPAYAKEFSH